MKFAREIARVVEQLGEAPYELAVVTNWKSHAYDRLVVRHVS